jgi:hypothetical protein
LYGNTQRPFWNKNVHNENQNKAEQTCFPDNLHNYHAP